MEKFSFKKRIKSFGYAGKGIAEMVKKEHNAWIHLTISVLVIIFGFLLNISVNEWLAVIICFGMVLALEAVNTAIERLVNLVSPEHNKPAGEVKDIAAGAVLIAAIAAAAVGLIIFVPKIVDWFSTISF